MASAAFTVNGSSVPPEVAVSASSTVTLALVSTTGVRTIAWSIVGNHSSAAVNPTITPAGSPSGTTATFVMPSGSSQAYLVQCVINGGVDESGQAVTNYTKRAIVGVVNPLGIVPFAVGEVGERSATHGYIEDLNAAMAAIGGGATDHGALTGLADDDHGTGANAYDLAFRPQVAYTGAANATVLTDARKHITTSHGSANTLTIPPNASVAYLTGTLLYGTNIGAGTMTLTAGAGVTLNGSVAVVQNGWWWAKKIATNTWQTFVGGGSGVTDHGALTGLTPDDDHPQYSLVTGTRAFTGGVTVTQAAVAASTPVALLVTGGAHTASIASTELVDADFALNRTVQFATGALTTQRAAVFRAPTYGFVGVSVITDAATLAITGAPAAGTNATITNAYALWVQAGSVRIGALGTGLVHASSTGVLTSSTLVNADVNAAAAIAGTKISPDFGSQVVRATGQFVGATSGTPTATSVAGSFESCTTTPDAKRGLFHRQASADAVGARVALQKSRGTHASPTAHSADDVLGELVALAWDDTEVFKLRAVGEAAGGTSKRVRFESMLHNGSALATGEKATQIITQTTDATLTTVYTIALAADDVVSMAIRWVGKQNASSNRAVRETNFTVRRSGSGDPVELSHSDATPLFRDDSGWGDDTQISHVINTSTDSVDIKVQGKAATTINWTVDVTWAVR